MTMLDMRSDMRSGTRDAFQRKPLPLPPSNCFRRMLTARAIASLNKEHPLEVAGRMWPNDRVVDALLRAATAPAMTTVTGWAAELAQVVVHDTVEALGPVSAGVQLIRQGLVLSFDGVGIISIPGFVADASNASFVAEGDPIPVRQLAAAPGQLLPHKIATIAVLTREMIESSNAEQLIGDALTRACGLALDAALFDSNPATAARPAGLRNGIAASTASSNATFAEAVLEDLATMFSVVGQVGGPGPYVLIVNPGRLATLEMRFIGQTQLNVLATPAVGNDFLAVAAAALVAAISATPEIETSNSATLHMNTVPLAVGPAGAAPHKSMFQTDSIAIKVRWPATWALRDPRGLAWITPTWK